MKKMRFIASIIIMCSLSTASFAVTFCGTLNVVGLTAQAERANGSLYANTMRVNVENQQCVGVKYAYLTNTQAAYSSVLSMLLSAQARGKTINIYVKDTAGIYSDAREIEWVSF